MKRAGASRPAATGRAFSSVLGWPQVVTIAMNAMVGLLEPNAAGE
jgi:hypothetical protein